MFANKVEQLCLEENTDVQAISLPPTRTQNSNMLTAKEEQTKRWLTYLGFVMFADQPAAFGFRMILDKQAWKRHVAAVVVPVFFISIFIYCTFIKETWPRGSTTIKQRKQKQHRDIK